MNNTGTIYSGLFNSETSNNLEFLENAVKENPTSSIARFLLLNYYKKHNHPKLKSFSDQSFLYFNNLYWIQLQLSEVPKIDNEKPIENSEKLNGAVAEKEAAAMELVTETQLEQVEDLPEEKLVENENIEIPVFTEEQNNSTEEVNLVEEPIVEEQNADDEEELSLIDQMEGQAIETPQQIISENEQVINDPEPENIAEPETDENVTEEAVAPADENDAVNNAPIPEESSEIQNPNSDEKETDKAAISEDTEEEVLEFEPLHTVDYFASQGIKIKEEALLNDKLGQQVKSFTAWLKSMKKLHPGKLPEQNEVIERIIQSSAEESNADAEVLTEAMAEVLIKQNKREKAIGMYEKLSLLNPAKSTYFAAKIESIKTN